MSELWEPRGREPEEAAAGLEARIEGGLRQKPVPAVPAGFAARVARAAAGTVEAEGPRRPVVRWGPRMAWVGAVLLLGLMAALAGTRGRGPWVLASGETLCVAEFVGALYAGARLGVRWG